MFRGNNNAKPTTVQIRALTDVLSAVGWNKGMRTATKWFDPDARWNSHGDIEEDEEVEDLSELQQKYNRLYRSDANIGELFRKSRDLLGRAPPCQREPNNEAHGYQQNGQSPYCIRCRVRACYHKLYRVAIVSWMVSLLSQGVLDEEELFESLEMVDEEEEVLGDEIMGV